jgi:hypothetical protein
VSVGVEVAAAEEQRKKESLSVCLSDRLIKCEEESVKCGVDQCGVMGPQ